MIYVSVVCCLTLYNNFLMRKPLRTSVVNYKKLSIFFIDNSVYKNYSSAEKHHESISVTRCRPTYARFDAGA